MRVAFLANEYPPLPSGGIGTNLRNQARELVRMGHKVWVVGWGHDEAFDDRGVRVRFVGATRVPRAGWLLNRRRAFRALRRLVDADGIQLVEAPDWCGPSAGLALPCPVVVRCHGSATYFADLVGDPLRWSVRVAESRALRSAFAVGAVSRFAADRTRELFGLHGDIAVLPNAIDVDRFRAADPAAIEPGTVLSFGTVVRKKGVLDLAPTVERLGAEHAEARLRLLGRDSADRQTGAPSTWGLLEAALSADGRARTAYLGAAPYDQVQEHVRRAAVCVFPSYGEALPLTWLEAMACAKPVVAYDIGWAQEVIDHGTTGLLVPAGDTSALAAAVGGLLADPERGHAMGRAARAAVERSFSTAVAADASLAWWREVIARHARARRR